ncbi:hypothetical protein ACI7RC_09580 [Brevibacillus sp. B_LB10_24]|uniref:hypothetical protein n=1 Tax=Brevibacillus sp. B_LB10_24 TaxID=3380645 RepID=UPI0038B7B057
MWFSYRWKGIVKNAVREVLFSSEFASFLRDVIEQANEHPLRAVVKQYVFKSVEVTTTAGTLTGTVTGAFEDYFRLQETATSYLLIPYRSLLSIRASK